MMKVLLSFLLVFNLHETSGSSSIVNVGDIWEFFSDDPPSLTPLIESGWIKMARWYSRVNLAGAKSIESYSGFLTVNKVRKSNLFFWFFLSKNSPRTDPILLWLQGGPENPSLFGLFTENGPFLVTNKLELKLRKNSWINYHSLLYIDNPVGTGFSFQKRQKYISHDQIVDELYNALLQFFQLFPELQKNEFFITGQSYAAKFVTSLGYKIMNDDSVANSKINLQGMAIGNGFVDPLHQFKHADNLFQLGFINFKQRDKYLAMEKSIPEYIEYGEYNVAMDEMFRLFLNYLDSIKDINEKNYVDNSRKIISLERNYLKYIHIGAVRRAIHVGHTQFSTHIRVSNNIPWDSVESEVPLIIELLNKYRMLFYTGQLDTVVNPVMVSEFLRHLHFSHHKEYQTAPRQPWYYHHDLAGYVKVAGKLTEVMVRNAGQLVPSDQPKWALDMITRFTRNKSFVTLPDN